MRAACAAVVAAGLALALGGGCSVIVPSTLDHVKCSRPGAIGPPDCGPGQVCTAGECVACTKSGACGDIGKPCTQDGGCPSGLFCLDPKAVLGQSGSPFCTRGCCTSSDCGSGDAVCWPTSKGSAVCRLASQVGRAKPGSGASGAACSANTDCRSGACSKGVCIDTCCSNGDCPSNAAPACALGPAPGQSYSAFYCAAGGAGAFRQACASNGDCQSEACMAVDFANAVCTQTCCKSSDCGDSFACAYYVNNGEATRLCVIPQSGVGAGVNGAACTSDSDCRSANCLDYQGQHVCSDACCRDSDCGNPDLACRPVSVNGTYVLRCVPL